MATIAAEDFVTALYRALLRREPDPDGLAHYIARLADVGPTEIVSAFAGSEEFRALDRPVDLRWLEMRGPMPVEARIGPADLDRLWTHAGGVWTHYGEDEPFWSVLTQDRFRSRQIDDASIDAFYASGRDEADRLEAWLARAGLAGQQLGTAVEYGCGIGRVSGWLAERCDRLHALDISSTHLDAARIHLQNRNIVNVDLIHVADRSALRHLADIDLFYSIIVLQHNPPPIILDILEQAFAGLNPNGLAFFQVPTFAPDYSFALENFWHDVAPHKTMEIHFVPQAKIFELARKWGLELIEVQPDASIGNCDRWISNTFLMRKGR